MEELSREKRLQLVREGIENFFNDDDLKFTPFDENDIASATFAVHSKFGHAKILYRAHADKVILQMIVPLSAGEEERAKVGEYLLRANYGLRVGGFDFDFDDGEISYRVSIYLGDENFAPPTHEQLDFATSVGLAMIDRYGDGLVKVMFGLAEPEDAVDAAESDVRMFGLGDDDGDD